MKYLSLIFAFGITGFKSTMRLYKNLSACRTVIFPLCI